MDDPPGGIRPDLSATADIVTATRTNALSVPIIALTVRAADDEEDGEGGDMAAPAEEEDDQETRELGPAGRSQDTDVEGVFVVVDGEVTFTPVEIGVTGQEHFEVLSGLSPGDTIVAGPYQQIRQLSNGDEVRAQENSGNGDSN